MDLPRRKLSNQATRPRVPARYVRIEALAHGVCDLSSFAPPGRCADGATASCSEKRSLSVRRRAPRRWARRKARREEFRRNILAVFTARLLCLYLDNGLSQTMFSTLTGVPGSQLSRLRQLYNRGGYAHLGPALEAVCPGLSDLLVCDRELAEKLTGWPL